MQTYRYIGKQEI